MRWIMSLALAGALVGCTPATGGGGGGGGSTTSTDFGSYASGAGVPSGWTRFGDGSNDPYSIESDGTALGSQFLRHATTAADYRGLAWDQEPTGHGDIEVLVKFRADVLTSLGPGVWMRASGADGNESGYFWALEAGSGVSRRRYNAGTSSTIGTSVSFTASADTWYWMRARLENEAGQVRLLHKMWADGGSEPTSGARGDGFWDTVDTKAARIENGDLAGIGPCRWLNTTYDFDFFSFAVDGDTAPGP